MLFFFINKTNDKHFFQIKFSIIDLIKAYFEKK